MKKTILLGIFFALFTILQAQKQADYWYFGHNAGIHFTMLGIEPLLNGALYTGEGCSAISDPDGNLLFYTDGISVWNKNHQLMPNGTNLLGHSSSTQSGIIVPKPSPTNQTDQYYIFTVDAYDVPSGHYLDHGLCYSLVDMTLEDGLGDVVTTEKNIQLVAPTCEKVTAVAHNNKMSIWVITHKWNSDTMYAYLVTTGGVNQTPVKSKVGDHIGAPLPPEQNDIYHQSKGYLKASPDGTKIAIANNTLYSIEVFDFNNSNGVISESSTSFRDGNFSQSGTYGIEFSPNSKVLYVSQWYGGSSDLWQYDLEAGSGAEILATKRLVASAGGWTTFGALQIGPDNRMYVAKNGSDYLSRINNPNVYGAGCNYTNDAIFLAGRESSYGLPPFIQSFFFMNISFSYDPPCFGTPTQFYGTFSEDPDSIRWEFIDDPPATYTIADPVHTFQDTTMPWFFVTLTGYVGGVAVNTFDLVVVHDPPDINLGNDTTFCSGTGYVTLDADTGFTSYLWQNGDTNQTITTDTSGVYWCEVYNQYGCSDRDSVAVIIMPEYSYTTDTSICEGESYITPGGSLLTMGGTYYDSLLTVGGCDSIYVTNLQVKDTFNVYLDVGICFGDSAWCGGGWQKVTGTYTDVYSTVLGCDSIIITNLLVSDEITVSRDTTICLGETIFLQGQWQSSPGIYHDTVSAGSNCDSVIITDLSIADTFEITSQAAICYGDSIYLGGNWRKTAGVYIDPLTSIHGCDSTVITTLAVNPNVQTMATAEICEGDSIFLGGSWRKTPSTYLDYYTTYLGCDSILATTLTIHPVFNTLVDTMICEGESIFLSNAWQDKPGAYTDAFLTFQGCDSTVITELSVDPLPYVELGNDTLLQKGMELELNAYSEGCTYEWQDGSTEPTFLVAESGSYYVSVTDYCGTVSDTIRVLYGDFYCEVVAPTAFTPDGDGLNDTFRPYLMCDIEENYKLFIYDRWGKQVFSTTKRDDAWDGKIEGNPAEQGVYTWVIFFKEGYFNDINERQVNGVITVLR